MDDIRAINNLQQLQFEVDLDRKKAYLEYPWHKGDLALMHTFVPEKFEVKP